MVCLPVHVPDPSEFMQRMAAGEFEILATPAEPEGMKKLYQTVFHKKRHWNTAQVRGYVSRQAYKINGVQFVTIHAGGPIHIIYQYFAII